MFSQVLHRREKRYDQYIKGVSTKLVIREIQFKATRYYYITTRMVKLKKRQNKLLARMQSNQEWDVNWQGYSKSNLAVSSQTEGWPAQNRHHTPTWAGWTHPHTWAAKDVSAALARARRQTTQMPINWRQGYATVKVNVLIDHVLQPGTMRFREKE